MLLDLLKRKEVTPSAPNTGQLNCSGGSNNHSGGSGTTFRPPSTISTSLLGHLRSAVQQGHGIRRHPGKPQKSLLRVDAKLSPYPTIPAKLNSSTGEVECGQCGREVGKIIDYGLEDEHTFYFIVQCPKCGRKNKYLKGTTVGSTRFSWVPSVQNHTAKLGGIMCNG